MNAQKHAWQEGKRFKGQTSPIKTIKKSATLIYHLVHIGLGIRIIGSVLNALSGVKIVIRTACMNIPVRWENQPAYSALCLTYLYHNLKITFSELLHESLWNNWKMFSL